MQWRHVAGQGFRRRMIKPPGFWFVVWWNQCFKLAMWSFFSIKESKQMREFYIHILNAVLGTFSVFFYQFFFRSFFGRSFFPKILCKVPVCIRVLYLLELIVLLETNFFWFLFHYLFCECFRYFFHFHFIEKLFIFNIHRCKQSHFDNLK